MIKIEFETSLLAFMDRVLRYDTSVETSRKERHFVGSDELFFRSHRCGNSRINERVCEKPKYLSLLLPHSKGTREGTFYFLIIERTIEQRSEGKNHNFPRKKKKNKRKIYHLGRNFIYFESRFNYQNEGWPSPSCNHRVL